MNPIFEIKELLNNLISTDSHIGNHQLSNVIVRDENTVSVDVGVSRLFFTLFPGGDKVMVHERLIEPVLNEVTNLLKDKLEQKSITLETISQNSFF